MEVLRRTRMSNNSICITRGYHEFRNGDTRDGPKELRHIKCRDCQRKAADYLAEGWVHNQQAV